VTYNLPLPSKLRAASERLSPDALPFMVGLGTMLVSTHVSGVSVAFPLIIGQLGVTVTKGQWILTAYTLALSASLLTFGGLADRIGFLRVYISGLAVFGISSGACAVASSVWALILLRGVQGVGAAMVSATSVALIGVSVARGRLGRALGWQTGMTYAGLALGPLLAGFVAQQFGWRSLFALNLPAAALAILAVRRAPPPHLERSDSHTRSWFGIPWMASMVALMLALSGRTGRILAVSAAALCAASLLRMNQRSREPLFAAWMVRSRPFTAAAVGETIYYACLYAIGFLMPLYLARGRGLTTTQIGIFLAFQSAARSLAAPVSGCMSDRVGAPVVIWLGIVLLAFAACCLYAFGGETTAAGIWSALILLGIGAGLFAPANSKVLLSASPVEKYGTSTGILATARNLGMTLGVTLAALLYSGFGGDITAIRTVPAVRAALVVIAGIAILYAALGVPSRRWSVSGPEGFEIS
jgi:MFS family permease